MEGLFVSLIVVLLIAGFVAFVIRSAPIIDEPYKSWALWGLLICVGLYVIFKFLLPLIHVAV